MGKLAWILLLLIIVAGVGYYLDQKGVIDVNVETYHEVGKEKTWSNNDFSQVTDDPDSHKGEKVNLDLYVFNSFQANSSNGTLTVYEAYLGTNQSLHDNPYDITKRVLLSTESGNLPVNACLNIHGYIVGKSTVETLGGQTIHPVHIKVTGYTTIDCSSLP